MVVVAWDALVAVVHPSNPVDDITREQLAGILEQNIRSWRELGGSRTNIVVVARRGKVSGVGYTTRQLILDNSEANFGRRVILKHSTAPVEKMVQGQPRAVAITGVSSARKRNLKILSVDGVAATADNIAQGTYPFFRPLYLVYKPGKNAATERFVRWLLGPRGQAIIREHGTVSLAQGAELVCKYAHFPDEKLIINFSGLMKLARSARVK
jgi:phosphate transport system substrate-binding protein